MSGRRLRPKRNAAASIASPNRQAHEIANSRSFARSRSRRQPDQPTGQCKRRRGGPPNCRTGGSVDARISACLAAIVWHRTAFGAQSRSLDPSPHQSTARAKLWRHEPSAAAPPAELVWSVSESHNGCRSRSRAKGRHDPGAPVARTHAHCRRPQRRVRARGPALSVAHSNCRADYRGPLVGSAVLWPDPARACVGWRQGRPMTRPMSLGTRRNARVRCAIYTRKSSEEGLDQEFNSLQAQREACEAFITSQRHEGWVCLRTGYDDGGFSGATMGRPALQRLLADIAAGRVDIVVVYKIDRPTRSLADFAKIVESHMPFFFDAEILSRMRSPVTSRSNWAKDNSTLSVRRPIELVVLNCCVTDTNDAAWASKISTSRAKSASDLVSRSTL